MSWLKGRRKAIVAAVAAVLTPVFIFSTVARACFVGVVSVVCRKLFGLIK